MPSSQPILARLAAAGGFLPLPAASRRRTGRWLRGLAESRLLEAADAACVSYGKSGRTWLRLMLSRFYQRQCGLREGAFLEYDNLSRLDARIPTLFFTHGNYLRDYTGHRDSVVEDFRDHRVLLLVRDPRDVTVSQYFQWKHRMTPHKRWLNAYPDGDADLTLWEFVSGHEAGLDRSIRFLDLWARARASMPQIEVIRYEDLRAEPASELRRALNFLGADPDEASVADAVEYARFDNMRRLEEEGGRVAASGRRLVPGRRGQTDSYKVRRAKVGGWRDYFDEEQAAELDARVGAGLQVGFGYRPDEMNTPDSPGASGASDERRVFV